MGLKTKLHETIKKAGSITYNELEALCHQWGYKVSTAQRRLRHSESPQIRSIEKNGSVIRYEWGNSIATDGYTAKKFMEDWGTKPKPEPKGQLF